MSIRRYLVLTLFSVLTLITFIAAIQGYKESMSQAQKQFDKQLLDFAHTLITIHKSYKPSSMAVTKQTIQIKQQSSFAFQLWRNQHLLIKSNNAPDHLIFNAQSSLNKSPHFLEVNFLQHRWRAVFLLNKGSPDKSENITVIVAQPLQAQFDLAQTLILAAVTPMILAIIMLSILIFIIVTQGLKPLHQLSQELSKRESNDFTPLNIAVHNNELADIVETLNKLFSRLDSAFQRERHFASDVAHELKTPLSVLKIDAHNLIQDLAEQKAISNNPLTLDTIKNFSGIKALNNSIDRMSYVIDQILNLNRTSASQITNTSRHFNVNTLLKQVISECYNDILVKEQRITLKSDDIFITAHEFSLQLLVANLISNANKYTPVKGEIMVCINHVDHKKVKLIIEDTGSGINPKEYSRVFDRFYRVGGDQHQSSVFGCGLGLTIVKHIADLHNAEIKLSRSSILKGLKVEVIFPIGIIMSDSSSEF
jgi:two-component system sensor histidine kinase QseC